MIVPIADREIRAFCHRINVKCIAPRFQCVALGKLKLLIKVAPLEDLRTPPGNRFEALKGDRAGQQHPHQRPMADRVHLAGQTGARRGNPRLPLTPVDAT